MKDDVPAAPKRRSRGNGEHLPAPRQPDDLLSAIIRAASDPRVDIAKVEHLVRLRREMEAAEAERLFHEAMSRAQAKMEPIMADAVNTEVGRPHRYATYAALDRAIRPIYTDEGFVLTFTAGERSTDTAVEVVAYLIGHGHSRRYTVTMPADGKGAKGGDVMSRTHAASSAISYGMRRLLTMIWNLATFVRDGDGNAAGQTAGVISAEQLKEINRLATDVKANVKKFCAFMQVPTLAEIPASRYRDAVAALEGKRRALQHAARPEPQRRPAP